VNKLTKLRFPFFSLFVFPVIMTGIVFPINVFFPLVIFLLSCRGCTDPRAGSGFKQLAADAAAVLLLDGSLRLGSAPETGGAGDLKVGACAAAVACGGAGEPSSVDGTALVSRLVPLPADRHGELLTPAPW
jgi:hypothetical protein